MSSGKFVAEIARAYKKAGDKLKFATKIALTNTAIQIRKDLGEEVKKVFNAPTRKTINAFYYRPAKRVNKKIISKVGIVGSETYGEGANTIKGEGGKVYAGSGIEFTKILGPHIEGGTRFEKASEKRMKRNGLMKKDEFLTPAAGVKLDKYGNVRGPYMVQVLSALKQFQDDGFVANITTESIGRKKKSKSKLIRKTAKWMSNVFAVKSGTGSHLSPGIYLRMGGKKNRGLRKLFHFVKRVNYKKRFNFQGVVLRGYNKHFQMKLDEAVAKLKV